MFSLIGKKVGMSQIFSSSGELVPVTVVEVKPNLVVGLKTEENYGYNALIVGYGEVDRKRLNKPTLGQYKNLGDDVRRRIYELRGLDVGGYKVGDFVKMSDVVKVGDCIDVQGTTRGHGFTGSVKLWNFKCGPKTHGSGYPHRFGGSLESGRGGSAPQKIWKGKKMAGRYGNSLVSVLNLEVVYVDEGKDIFFVRGSVPGRSNGILKIKPTSRNVKRVSNPFQIYEFQAKN